LQPRRESGAAPPPAASKPPSNHHKSEAAAAVTTPPFHHLADHHSSKMVTDEPFTIDTSNYNTSRVVITPQTPTEPTYELEKIGHTSVIRVSYPGPEPGGGDSPKSLSGSKAAANRDSPSAPHHRPSLAARGGPADAAMGLDSFQFVAVLGRGHFGKVSVPQIFSLVLFLNKICIDTYFFIGFCLSYFARSRTDKFSENVK
jgi:hypothetical protein